MHMLVKATIVLATVASPILSVAQSTAPPTRAQVESELVQWEKAGYSPVGSDLDYPENLKTAEARLAVQADRSNKTDWVPTGYGSSRNGSSASGAR